ncbi:dihydrofolate reductase [Mucisphaera calidilacus]|uniref:Dihydrofolate reductase n=1 Tax=Mucisphaera calidilacus TaxID=2527982 RepID=A0A518BVW9_9BACT|nr:dihydrofolate reductase [Mucisphaera calidilacus]QDU71119.1 Dihydrofolate reductase type 3 [Mucisphaera calidilacus]
MILSLIYARSENHVIGRDGKLPWRLPEDFRHFKRTTLGHPIIMGRRTFEDHNAVLPGRTNIVLTRNPDFPFPGITARRTLDDALAPYRDTDEEVFIIGGAGLFAEAFPMADRVYETVVHAEVEGDVVLSAFDFSGWNHEVLMEHPVDERHEIGFTVTRRSRMSHE